VLCWVLGRTVQTAVAKSSKGGCCAGSRLRWRSLAKVLCRVLCRVLSRPQGTAGSQRLELTVQHRNLRLPLQGTAGSQRLNSWFPTWEPWVTIALHSTLHCSTLLSTLRSTPHSNLHSTLHSTFARLHLRSLDSPFTAPCTAPLPDFATAVWSAPHPAQHLWFPPWQP